MADGPSPDQERQVEQIRAALEEEFQLKHRQAKVQEHRVRERLKQDQEAWEAHKREEKARLAQAAETLRRREENAQRAAHRKEEARAELDVAREDVERERRAWDDERVALVRRTEGWQEAWARAHAARRRAAVVAVGALVMVLLSAVSASVEWAYAAAVLLAVQALVLARPMQGPLEA